MNASESAHESLATRFWSGLLLRSLRDGCDQIHVSPIADRYLVRVHDHVGWRELHVEGSPDLYDSLVPRLKALVGYPSSDPIAPPGARCVLRLASNNEFHITVMTRRTEAGGEEVFVELPESR